MWNDIHNNAARLSENKIVKSLASEKLEWETDGLPTTSDLDGSYLPSVIALPISADATQLDAICAAAQNKSFILHGPPGPGKSQTITNIIANALYQRKKILFVAEKMAALNKAKTKQLASLSQHLVSLPDSPPTLLNIDHPERQLAQILELADHGQKRDSHRDTKVTNVYKCRALRSMQKQLNQITNDPEQTKKTRKKIAELLRRQLHLLNTREKQSATTA